MSTTIWYIPKFEAVTKRMRWKAKFFEANIEETEENEEDHQSENYGLKSKNTPEIVTEMANFK